MEVCREEDDADLLELGKIDYDSDEEYIDIYNTNSNSIGNIIAIKF